MTLILENGKINHNGKIFDKVSPAVTWKVKPCAWRAVKEKKFEKQDVNRLLLAVFAKRWACRRIGQFASRNKRERSPETRA